MMEDLRKKIDEIDDEILRLYLKRLTLTDEIGKIKARSNAKVEVKDRESEIIKRLSKSLACEDEKSVAALYNAIFSESKRRQNALAKKSDVNFKAALIGENVSTSFSQILHSYFNTDYDLVSLKNEELKGFIENSGYDFFNVTMPYKREIIPYLDQLIGAAKDIGVVNTVKVENDKKSGYNTDIDGLRYLFESENVDLKDKNVVILGTGATSLSAKYLAETSGAKKITAVGRTSLYNYRNYQSLDDTQILINTTPIGKNSYESLIDLTYFPHLEFVCDVIYSPLNTKLITDAKSLGVKCAGGLKMLIYQAARAEEIWQEKPFTHKVEEIYDLLLKQIKNIVLIGMPSAGKTVIGKVLSEKLDRSFIDIDEEIEKNQSVSAAEIIESKGEEYFRDLETQTIKKFAYVKSSVISTGGGAVLKEENITYLKQNSVIVYIDRDLKFLTDVCRPLSGLYGNEELFRKRKPLYEKYADLTVKNDDEIDKIAERIIDAYENFSD